MRIDAGHRLRGAVGVLAAAFLATVLAFAPMRVASADAATVSHDHHPAAATQHLVALPVHKHSRLAIHKYADRHAVDAVLADLPVLGAVGLVHEIARTGGIGPGRGGHGRGGSRTSSGRARFVARSRGASVGAQPRRENNR